jgi:hypothetical protein
VRLVFDHAQQAAVFVPLAQLGVGEQALAGGQTAARSKIVGYCRLHRVHLTESQVKSKECLRKECRALKKWDCAFWNERERKKYIKQMKKERGIPSWQRVDVKTDEKEGR